uniref:Uncharacterized protein n=1 Tax=Felis catus TaxID=9685 RepID=A0ABI7XCX6_FELCA
KKCLFIYFERESQVDCILHPDAPITSLYNLDSNPILNMPLTDIFSQSVGYLLVLLVVSFTVQKRFILMWSQ